jgi:ribosome modulation factor
VDEGGAVAGFTRDVGTGSSAWARGAWVNGWRE